MLAIMRNKKGQNTAEYAILIALVIGAVIAMQTYVKRGLQSGVKYVVDKSNLKADGTSGDTSTSQYEPYYIQSEYDTTRSAFKDVEKVKDGGEVFRVSGVAEDGTITGKKTERKGSQKITKAEDR